MSQAVIIKSSKNGINLVLDASMPSPELLTEILHKFTEAERFFANASFAISFEGRELSDEEKSHGVIACSAGNHAQGVALAATKNGIKSLICLPDGAPISKVEATKRYGADI